MWRRLRQRGCTRRSESLFRVMKMLGLFLPKEKKPACKIKPYQQMDYSGQRGQVDVKVVSCLCIVDPELRLYQYTAIDGFSLAGIFLPSVRSGPSIPLLTSAKGYSDGIDAGASAWGASRRATVLNSPTVSSPANRTASPCLR